MPGDGGGEGHQLSSSKDSQLQIAYLVPDWPALTIYGAYRSCKAFTTPSFEHRTLRRQLDFTSWRVESHFSSSKISVRHCIHKPSISR